MQPVAAYWLDALIVLTAKMQICKFAKKERGRACQIPLAKPSSSRVSFAFYCRAIARYALKRLVRAQPEGGACQIPKWQDVMCLVLFVRAAYGLEIIFKI